MCSEGLPWCYLLDIRGSHQLLCSSHVRERDKMLLRSIMAGGVWNGFLLSKVRGEVVPCRFCGFVMQNCQPRAAHAANSIFQATSGID